MRYLEREITRRESFGTSGRPDHRTLYGVPRCTSAATRKIRAAVEKAGSEASYHFDYETREAVITVPDKVVSLAEYTHDNDLQAHCPRMPSKRSNRLGTWLRATGVARMAPSRGVTSYHPKGS